MKRFVLVPLLVLLPSAAPAQKPEDMLRSQAGQALLSAAIRPGDVLRVQVELRDTEGAPAGSTVVVSKLVPRGVNDADGCAQLAITVRNRAQSDNNFFFPQLRVHAAIGFPKRNYRFAVAGDELCPALAAAAGPMEAVERDEGGQAIALVKEIANLAPDEAKTVTLAVKVTGDDIVQNPGFRVFVEGDPRLVLSGPKMYRSF